MSVRISGRPHGTGLTLVEVAFALSVLAVALLGVAGMFPSAMRSVHVGGQTTKATVLARGMVDMIRADAFDSLVSRYNAFDTSRWTIACPLSPSTPAGLDPDFNKKKWTCDMAETGSRNTGQGLPEGRGTIAVVCAEFDLTAPFRERVDTSCSKDIRKITVTVTWGCEGSRSVSLVTYVARME